MSGDQSRRQDGECHIKMDQDLFSQRQESVFYNVSQLGRIEGLSDEQQESLSELSISVLKDCKTEETLRPYILILNGLPPTWFLSDPPPGAQFVIKQLIALSRKTDNTASVVFPTYHESVEVVADGEKKTNSSIKFLALTPSSDTIERKEPKTEKASTVVSPQIGWSKHELRTFKQFMDQQPRSAEHDVPVAVKRGAGADSVLLSEEPQRKRQKVERGREGDTVRRPRGRPRIRRSRTSPSESVRHLSASNESQTVNDTCWYNWDLSLRWLGSQGATPIAASSILNHKIQKPPDIDVEKDFQEHLTSSCLKEDGREVVNPRSSHIELAVPLFSQPSLQITDHSSIHPAFAVPFAPYPDTASLYRDHSCSPSIGSSGIDCGVIVHANVSHNGTVTATDSGMDPSRMVRRVADGSPHFQPSLSKNSKSGKRASLVSRKTGGGKINRQLARRSCNAPRNRTDVSWEHDDEIDIIIDAVDDSSSDSDHTHSNSQSGIGMPKDNNDDRVSEHRTKDCNSSMKDDIEMVEDRKIHSLKTESRIQKTKSPMVEGINSISNPFSASIIMTSMATSRDIPSSLEYTDEPEREKSSSSPLPSYLLPRLISPCSVEDIDPPSPCGTSEVQQTTDDISPLLIHDCRSPSTHTEVNCKAPRPDAASDGLKTREYNGPMSDDVEMVEDRRANHLETESRIQKTENPMLEDINSSSNPFLASIIRTSMSTSRDIPLSLEYTDEPEREKSPSSPLPSHLLPRLISPCSVEDIDPPSPCGTSEVHQTTDDISPLLIHHYRSPSAHTRNSCSEHNTP